MKRKSSTQTPVFKIILLALGIIVGLLVITIIIIPAPQFTQGLETLEAATQYAKLRPEVEPESANTIKPEYTKYLDGQKPTWKSKISAKFKGVFYRLGLTKPPLWSASFFAHQIKEVSLAREAKGFKGNVIVKVTPGAQSKIVLFGNVQAAYQSLVRCLIKLKDLNIIGNDFKLTSPDHIIIFTGDIISRAPFSMETMSLVCRLIQQNPDNVIWNKGNHETNNYWQEHTLKTELQIRASTISAGTVPLVDEVNKLFNTLPIATYISTRADGSREVIRISDAGRTQSEELKEERFSLFLTSKSEQRIAIHKLETDQKGKPDDVDVRVIFKGEKKRDSYQPHDGLRLLPPDMGSVAWTTLSCPTPLYQKAIKYKHDAFVVIAPSKSLDEWTITLYNRDVTTQNPFAAKTFMLLSGVEEGKVTKQQAPASQAPPSPQAQPAVQTQTQQTPTTTQAVQPAASSQPVQAQPVSAFAPAQSAAQNNTPQPAAQQQTSAFSAPAQQQTQVAQTTAIPQQQVAPQQPQPVIPQKQDEQKAAPQSQQVSAFAQGQPAAQQIQKPSEQPKAQELQEQAGLKPDVSGLAKKATELGKEAQDLAQAAQKFAQELEKQKEQKQ